MFGQRSPQVFGVSPQVGWEIAPGEAGNLTRFGGIAHRVRLDISPGWAGNLTTFGLKSPEVWREISQDLDRGC